MATYMVELKEGYNLNDADWKSSMKIFVEQYKGSDPVVVEMLGFQFSKLPLIIRELINLSIRLY